MSFINLSNRDDLRRALRDELSRIDVRREPQQVEIVDRTDLGTFIGTYGAWFLHAWFATLMLGALHAHHARVPALGYWDVWFVVGLLGVAWVGAARHPTHLDQEMIEVSHFTLLVLMRPGTDLDAHLGPFDENVQVPRYRDYVDEPTPGSDYRARWLRKEGLLAPSPTAPEDDPFGTDPEDALTWSALAEAYNARSGEEGYPVDHDNDLHVEVDAEAGTERAFTWSTYNPASKWDWWSIGGRWSDRLLRIDGSRCDGPVPKSELAIAELRGMEDLEARLERQRIVKAIDDAEAVASYRTWESIRDAVPDDFDWSTGRDAVRASYWEQPAVVRYQATLTGDDARWFDFDGASKLDRYLGAPEDLVAKRAAADAWPGFALLDVDGRWHEKGQMGWWGMSSDTESTRIGYLEVANALIDDADDDTLFVSLDCHI